MNYLHNAGIVVKLLVEKGAEQRIRVSDHDFIFYSFQCNIGTKVYHSYTDNSVILY